MPIRRECLSYFHEDKIVAILGVGNNATGLVRRDIDLVTLIERMPGH